MMNQWRPKLGAVIGVVCIAACGIAETFAQAPYPNKPVKIVVPFAAGSGTDIVARAMAEEFSKALGQQFVVDNKAGASAQIAAEFVAKAAPDGYTLFVTTNTPHSANPHLFKKLNYEPVKDFTPIARTIYLPFVLVVDPTLGVNSVADLVERVKLQPGKFSYAFGNSSGQVAGAAFVGAFGGSATAIPYKSTPPAMTDLIGGQVQFMFVDLAAGSALMKAGKLKPLAVAGERRSALLSGLPTVSETPGFAGFDVISWGALLAPAGLPKDIVERLNTETRKLFAKPEFKEKMAGLGFEPALSSPEELRGFMEVQVEAWGKKIRAAGIVAE